MSRFRVWAPLAERVELELDGRRLAMRREPTPAESAGGWWSLEVEGADAGRDYAFRLDGGEPLPDPRSPFQPRGVLGPSRTVDQAAFPWRTSSWRVTPLREALFYELHVGTFTPAGTFDAAIERLDHLVELGATHVELMPVNEFSGARGWGYDGVDLYAPHHAYGGPDGLKRLVDACHARGLACVLDVVYNHLGPVGNFLGRFGPYFTERYATPWGPALNLDGPDSDEVRRFLVDDALHWLRDYRFDGLRIDAVHAILDASAEHLLEQMAREVRELEDELGRPLLLVAESDLNDPRVLRPPELGGHGLHAQWSDDFHHALHAALTGEREGYYADFGTLAALGTALERAFVHAGDYSIFRRRRHGRAPVGIAGERFLGYLQNHDQVGNRARGERSSQLVSTERLKVGAALVLTAPFTPLLFQGEEWGASAPFLYFTDHADPELGEAVRRGRRAEFAAFGWDPEDVPDPQARESFERSKLDWEERLHRPHADLFAWHRDLVRLRRALPDLHDGRLERVRARSDERAQWLVVERGAIAVACNLAPRRQCVPLRVGPAAEVLLASEPTVELGADGRLELPADSVAVCRS